MEEIVASTGGRPIYNDDLEALQNSINANTQLYQGEQTDDGLETFKFNYGRNNNIRVGNIISSICTATNLNGKSIGKIQIFNEYSLVDLPKNLKKETKNQLKNLRIKK